MEVDSMPEGYMGKILRVDLSKNELKDEPLDEKLARQFIGGYGIGARIIFSEQKAGVDPLGPDNIFGILTGPLTGTQAISGTRFTAVGKSPLTGCWGDANAGGYFGAYLKFAGYDAVFFTGISEKPVYLFIDNGKAELRDAAQLWGRDTYETEDILKTELGKDVAVACIGQSGEKLSLISGIVHSKGSVAARSGLGAVMGSKKLKALAVKGKIKVPVADEKKTSELRKKYLAEMGGGQLDRMRKYGTTFVTVPSAEGGDTPVKNWGGVPNVDFPDAKLLDGDFVIARQLKPTGCFRCPVGCEAIMREGRGEYKYEAGSYRPEYETIAMLGTNCLNNNIDSIIKTNDICNRYGIDTISTGATIAFAMECFENGLINKTDTDGIEMTWGNHKAIVAMTEKIARREGLGDILADGVRLAAQKIGKGADKYAIHIHGQEVPAHNPRAGFDYATIYVMDATPARHTQGSEEMHPDGLLPRFNRLSYSGRGKVHKMGSNFQHSLVCAGVCLFVYINLPNANIVTEFMSSVTGRDITADELLKTGERIANIRQAFNLREGLNQLQYEIPGRVLGKPPQTEGPLAGMEVDIDTLVSEYLAEMDWDPVTAKPSAEKLKELDLEDIASEI